MKKYDSQHVITREAAATRDACEKPDGREGALVYVKRTKESKVRHII